MYAHFSRRRLLYNPEDRASPAVFPYARPFSGSTMQSFFTVLADDPFRLIAGLAVFVFLLLLLRFYLGRRRFPWVFEARVLYVCDGDSVWVTGAYRGRLKLRIAGIDAPEYKQPFGRESAKFLQDLVKGRRVTVKALARDEYGRFVSIMTVGKKDVGLALLDAGLAWAYRRYFFSLSPEMQKRYADAAERAARARIGLWQDEFPEAPWDWRTRRRPLHTRFVYWLKKMLRRLFRRLYGR